MSNNTIISIALALVTSICCFANAQRGASVGACCIEFESGGYECYITDRESCIAKGGEWTKGQDCESISCGDGGCPTGYIPDCSGDGDCIPEDWIGDGFCDGFAEEWGANLCCYDSDGGDCTEEACSGTGDTFGACCVDAGENGYYCVDGDVNSDFNEESCNSNGGVWTGGADCLSISCGDDATIWYVDQSSTNTPDGTSWATAFLDVQDALDVASSGDQIWIAQGWYIPTDRGSNPKNPREASFRLIAGVEIYGGFSGNETGLDQQQPDIYQVVFSGDLYGDDGEGGNTTSENAYHVVTGDALVGSNPILDGVYIRSGNANNAADNKFGGGLIVSNTPTGSAAYPLVRQCRFVLNQAFYGGGVATRTANDSVALIHCTFANNYALQLGGAIWNNGSCGVDNTLIVGNSCEEVGGALFSAGDQLKLINTTITQNSAGYVAGIYIQSGNNNVGSNNIVWGNRDVNGDHIQLHIEGGSWSGNYNCIEGIGSSFGGVGNIDLDPRFVNEFGNDGDPGTGDEDFHLLQQSPCIDAGDNTVVTESYDFDGDDRLIDDPYTVDTGFGEPPIVDMGVDEHTPELSGGDVAIWDGGVSNYFDDYKNWLPSGVPGIRDTAIFNVSGPRLVQFYNDNTVGGLFVTGGDLTFDLSGIILELASQSDPLRALSFDSPSSITFKGGAQAGGTLKIQNAQLQLNGSNISFEDGVELRTQGILLRDGTTFNFDGDMYGNLTNTGSVIQPGGRNVGQLVIYGDLIHRANQKPDADNTVGSMVFDLNVYDFDGNVGSDHIQIRADGDVGGSADIECVIELRWDRLGLAPTNGDTYDILTSPYVLGQPTVVYCSGLPSDLAFNWFTPGGPGIRGGSEGGVETTGPILFESSGSADLDNSTEPYDIVVADFDGVNGPDVAMSVPDTGGGAGSVVILLNNGMNGDTWLGFTESSPITVGIDPRDIEVGDFNNDETANDLVVANYASNTVSVLVNDGNANFTQTDVVTDANPMFIAVGDFVANDKAGLVDIAIACDSFLVTVLQNTGPMGMRGVGFFKMDSLAIPEPADLDPGDVTNDKDLDYICLDLASEEVRVLEGTGDGGVVSGPIGSVTGTSLPNGSEPVELEFADLNADGIPDVITVNEGDDSLSILLGDGTEFGSASSFTVGTSPQSMTVYDFDNDLDDDLVVSIINVERELVIIRNDSTGTVVLSAGDAVGSGSDPILVEHGDFDQDGLEDLACVIDLGGAPLRGHVNPGIGIYFNTTLVTCDGDINSDGAVDVVDLLAIIGAWGNTSGPEDIDGDGVVAVGDLLIVIGNWGSC